MEQGRGCVRKAFIVVPEHFPSHVRWERITMKPGKHNDKIVANATQEDFAMTLESSIWIRIAVLAVPTAYVARSRRIGAPMERMANSMAQNESTNVYSVRKDRIARKEPHDRKCVLLRRTVRLDRDNRFHVL